MYTTQCKRKYLQIAGQIKKEIFCGNLQGNTPLPTIRKYAIVCQVSISTVSKALQFLEGQGIIYARRTTGYYVVPHIYEKKKELAMSLIEDLVTAVRILGYTEEDLLLFVKEYKKDVGK